MYREIQTNSVIENGEIESCPQFSKQCFSFLHESPIELQSHQLKLNFLVHRHIVSRILTLNISQPRLIATSFSGFSTESDLQSSVQLASRAGYMHLFVFVQPERDIQERLGHYVSSSNHKKLYIILHIIYQINTQSNDLLSSVQGALKLSEI